MQIAAVPNSTESHSPSDRRHDGQPRPVSASTPEPGRPNPPIEVRDLTRIFGHRTVLDGINFSVAVGAITGFLGPNGAGKSTTMRILVGLDRPTTGRALVDGVPYRELDAPGRRVGTLIDTSGMHPRRTGRNHLLVLADLIGTGAARVDWALDEVGLADAADRRVGEYSLGMRRRLGLASALLGEPDILVLDEPSNGLDPSGIRWLRGKLKAFAAGGGTVFLSSHVLGEIAQTVDNVIVIDHGRIVADTTVAALTSQVVVVRTPDTAGLSSMLGQRGATVHRERNDRLEVVGLTQEAIGMAAFHHGIPLIELYTRAVSLEEQFLTLTEEVTDNGTS